MRRIENLTLVVLIFCLFICAQFWRQISHIRVPPNVSARVEVPLTTHDALPPILSIGQLSGISLPTGRDVFRLPWRKEDNIRLPVPLEPPPVLSTIVWSDTIPHAIINGEILALGKIDSHGRFRVENITRESVQIYLIKDKKLLQLTLASNQSDPLERRQVTSLLSVDKS